MLSVSVRIRVRFSDRVGIEFSDVDSVELDVGKKTCCHSLYYTRDDCSLLGGNSNQWIPVKYIITI